MVSAGSCSITANQAGNTNYDAAAPCDGQLRHHLRGADDLVHEPRLAVVRAGGSVPLTVSGGASGNSVVLTSNSPGVCTVSGSTVTMVSAGSCSITANQAGNTNYDAAAL